MLVVVPVPPDSRSPFGRLGWKLALALGSIVFTLAVGELLTRLLVAALHRPPIIVSDSDRGWAGRPHLKKTLKVYAGGRFSISTDDRGRRITYADGEGSAANAR